MKKILIACLLFVGISIPARAHINWCKAYWVHFPNPPCENPDPDCLEAARDAYMNALDGIHDQACWVSKHLKTQYDLNVASANTWYNDCILVNPQSYCQDTYNDMIDNLNAQLEADLDNLDAAAQAAIYSANQDHQAAIALCCPDL